jgi:formylglycine-generating enzyme required for sulfatase activity
MSADLAARLRALTQDYHEGRLNLAAYRALRAPLLDSLVAAVPNAADMEVTRPRAARPATTAPSESASAPAEAPRRRWLPFLIVAGVSILAAAGLVLWLLKGNAGSSVRATADAADPGVHSGAVYQIVVPFMERGDWSDAPLAMLNASLLEAGDQALARVAHEHWFQRFVDELRRRLKEHQALAPAALTPGNSAIAALAVTVGLDLNSPDAAIHVASVPPPAPEHASSSEAASATAPAGDVKEGSRAGSHPAQKAESAPAGGNADRANPAARNNGEASVSGAGESARSPTASSSGVLPASTGAARDSGCRAELIGSRRPLCSDVLPTGEGPLLALVPAGSFEMGSQAASDEQPVHRVTISVPFAISVNEVSQAEFRQFCEHTGRSCAAQPWTGDDYPVVNVSWSDARAYVEWLSSLTHQRYRLPTEAQWEYAARAGQTGLFPGGDALSPTDAHFSMATKQSAPARRSEKYKANKFRLLHTLGNVREWVDDAWVPGYEGAPADGSAVKPGAAAGSRVTRGGSYVDGSARLRLSLREGVPEGTRDAFTGFRVVRELP